MISLIVRYSGGDETTDAQIIAAAKKKPIGGGRLSSASDSLRDLEWRCAYPEEAAELVHRLLVIPGLDMQLRSS